MEEIYLECEAFEREVSSKRFHRRLDRRPDHFSSREEGRHPNPPSQIYPLSMFTDCFVDVFGLNDSLGHQLHFVFFSRLTFGESALVLLLVQGVVFVSVDVDAVAE